MQFPQHLRMTHKVSIAKEKKWGKKGLEICAIKGGGGVRRPMANAILNVHFDYLNLSLTLSVFFLALCQTKPSRNLTKILKLVDWLKALNEI